MTEQDGHPPPAPGAPARPLSPLSPTTPAAGPDERTTPLAEAAAALGFAEPARPQPDAATRQTEPAETQTSATQTYPVGPPPRATSPVEAPPAASPAAQPPAQPPAPPPAGVPPRPQPLPPPRPVRPPAGAPPSTGRPAVPRPTAGGGRPVARTRKARLVLKRIDPWSVFLYSVVASIFIGLATLVAIGLLYAVLSKLGVLNSLNTLVGDVTAAPGATAQAADVFSAGKVMTFATLIAALDVVLITALSTLGALLYNVCASLTGGIEVTLTDQG